MSELWSGIVTVVTAIIGVAILAVIVSNRSNTATVLQNAGNAFSSIITAAIRPVSEEYLPWTTYGPESSRFLSQSSALQPLP